MPSTTRWDRLIVLSLNRPYQHGATFISHNILISWILLLQSRATDASDLCHLAVASGALLSEAGSERNVGRASIKTSTSWPIKTFLSVTIL